MTLKECWNYGRAITNQFPISQRRVLFAASGTQPAAVVVRDDNSVIESSLYWTACASDAEALYLTAILNSETLRAANAGEQAEGQWGKRHFHKVAFNSSIPLFNGSVDLHKRLANAGARAETVAATVPLKDGEHFTRARKRIRQGLIADGVAGEIETLVATLIGVAAPATPTAGDDDGQDDAD